MAERDRRRVKVMDRFHLVAVPTHDTTRPSGSKVCPEQNRWCLVVGLEVAPADGSITNDPLACRARLAGHARGAQGLLCGLGRQGDDRDGYGIIISRPVGRPGGPLGMSGSAERAGSPSSRRTPHDALTDSEGHGSLPIVSRSGRSPAR